MKVILLKSVQKVGKKDEIVEVAAGFAQHSLFPKKLAIPATAQTVEAVARRKQNTIAEKEVRHHLLDQAIKDLNGMEIAMPVKANEKGSLFSKIHETDIATFLLNAHRISIAPQLLSIEGGPIKAVGTHTIHVADDTFTADFNIEVTKQ